MKTIVFRTLRRIKKTGKIVVASYMQWRKVKTADYSKFKLIVDAEYRGMPADEYVYNHKGEQIFWYNHKDPEALPLSYADMGDIMKHLFGGEEWKFTEPLHEGFHWSVRGFDCDGVPCFAHYTADYIGTHYEDVTPFEPLTVGMVSLWFGWFLYRLKNTDLQIGK